MANTEPQIDQVPRHRDPLSRMPLEDGLTLAPEGSRHILDAHLDHLGTQLSGATASADPRLVRETLLEVVSVIRAGRGGMFGRDYRKVLERLVAIYARGFDYRNREIYATTAADYAEVIETISRAFPSYDYSEALGQLLCYMTRLFTTRESSWKEVYEHILSIPDSIEAKQLLNRAFFLEIQEWAEAGVENLFSIRRDLYRKIGDLAAQARRIEREIEALDGPRGTSESGRRPKFGDKVVDLVQIRKGRLIGALERERREILDRKASEEAIAGLIESDIREFEEKLRATRRAYFIRPV